MSFDGFAKKYDKYNKLHFGPEYDTFRERTIAGCAIEPYSAVLEFGCGTSLCLEHILKTRDFRGTYLGLDISGAMLEQGREKFANGNVRAAHVQIGRAGPLPVRSGSIDAIVSSLVLHLLPRERRAELFSEFRRVLRPGGSLCLNEFGKPENLKGKLFRLYVLYFWALFVKDERNSRDLFDGRLLSEVREFFPGASIRERTLEAIDHIVAKAAGYPNSLL